jgi:hypothetical protein
MDVFNAINSSCVDEYSIIYKKYSVDEHKSFAKLYYNLYNGCLNFKENETKNSNKYKSKNVDCTSYYKKFKMHSQAYVSKIEKKEQS